MKRKIFLLAVAVAALASCSSDETLSVNQGLEDANTISFRPAIQGMTRAANGNGVKSAWETGDILYVNAVRDVSGTKKLYFQDNFTKDANGFNSSTKHFWPTNSDLTTNHLYFTAFWGAAYKTISAGSDLSAGTHANKQFKLGDDYTVDADVANQMDLLFAMSNDITSRPPNGMVTLNFRHMLSQICVKVANSEPNMKITITGVRVGFVSNKGTFTYNGSNTENREVEADGNAGNLTTSVTLIDRTNWAIVSATKAMVFDQTVTPTTLNGNAAARDFAGGFTPWILMPQQLTPASDYSTRQAGGAVTTATAPTLNGAYIALKMAIYDSGTDASILDEQWCYWPINTEWKPGYKYTYTINAGSGGYQPTDQDNSSALDPVLSGLVIWFDPVCTIDAWVTTDAGTVTNLEYDYLKGRTYTVNKAASAAGTLTYTIGGLTAGSTVAENSPNNNLSAISVSPTTVPASGIVTVTATLTGNATTSPVTSTITVTESGTGSSSTTIDVIQAAAP